MPLRMSEKYFSTMSTTLFLTIQNTAPAITETVLYMGDFNYLSFIEERFCRHGGILGDTEVIAITAAALTGKHCTRTCLGLLELQMLVDGKAGRTIES